jgi:hypothetical protein
MRFILTVGVLAMSLTGCKLADGVEQTSQPPMSKVPAAARGKEVKALCAKAGTKDNPLCKGMDELGKKKAEAHH